MWGVYGGRGEGGVDSFLDASTCTHHCLPPPYLPVVGQACRAWNKVTCAGRALRQVCVGWVMTCCARVAWCRGARCRLQGWRRRSPHLDLAHLAPPLLLYTMLGSREIVRLLEGLCCCRVGALPFLVASDMHLPPLLLPTAGPLADQQDLVLRSQQQCSTLKTTGESQGGDEGVCPTRWITWYSGDLAVERSGLQLSLACAPYSPLWLVTGVGAGY